MCPISGGNWNNASNAGVWYVNLNNVRSNSNNNVSFRADSDSPRTAQADGGAKGGAFRRVAGLLATAKSAGFRHSGRAGSGVNARFEGLAT